LDHILPSSTIPRGIYDFDSDDSVPKSVYKKSDIVGILSIADLLMAVQLCNSKSDARRLIQQGGAYINGVRILNFDQMLTENDIIDHEILLRAGKKKYHKIILKQV